MKIIRKLPDAVELKTKYSLTEEQKKERDLFVNEIKGILDGTVKKKILLIGPCSADREDSVLEYMIRLARLKDEVKDKFCVIPRIYTSKPRTNGNGYKGLVHRPFLNDVNDDIYDGIIAARKMHLHVIQETGMFGADEMLYPDVLFYIDDVLSYTAVGARSVENQQHRLVASGLDMPVGMKNPTSGDLEVMLNAIFASQNSQHCIFHGCECETEGNPYSHAILRGYTDAMGKSHSNYHFENISDLYDLYCSKNIRNANVIIDCNHGNSRKHYDEQCRISQEVFSYCKNYTFVDSFVKGIMIESYLEDGSQMFGENFFGKSVTDPCLGWDKTEKLIRSLFENI